jgi:hypothetical protein
MLQDVLSPSFRISLVVLCRVNALYKQFTEGEPDSRLSEILNITDFLKIHLHVYNLDLCRLVYSAPRLGQYTVQ